MTGALWGRADVDVGFFADADAVADAVDVGAFEGGVEGEVVETAVCEAVAIVFRALLVWYLEVGKGGIVYISHSYNGRSGWPVRGWIWIYGLDYRRVGWRAFRSGAWGQSHGFCYLVRPEFY